MRTPTQHLQNAANVDDDFSGVFFNTGLIGPFACLQGAFYVNLRAFTQIFTGNFSKLAEQHNTVPFGFFFLLTGALSRQLSEVARVMLATALPFGM
ncbi:hypothetical protein IY40_24515 [Serratia marcescens]|nr:hypothetical protein IY40_24515 [Serratia marcescens]